MSSFKVGDKVWSWRFGFGCVTNTNIDNDPYIIEVKWECVEPRYDYFTKDGQYDLKDPDLDYNIHLLVDTKSLEY